MVQIQGFQVLLHKSHYYAGEKVTGAVRFDAKKPVCVESVNISLKCEGHTSWLNKTSEQALEFRKQYCSSNVDIANLSTGVISGNFVKNFEISLPSNLPSSYIGEYGSIIYCCVARMTYMKEDNSDLKEIKSDVNFTVIARVDKTKFRELMKSVEIQDSETISHCCFKSGSISAVIRFKESVFNLGDSIRFKGSIENNSGHKTVRNVKAKLMQFVTFFGESEFQNYTETKVLSFLVASREKGPVLPRQSQEWNEEDDSLSLNNKLILPTQKGFLIDISYKLIFDIDNGPMIEVPIAIANFH